MGGVRVFDGTDWVLISGAGSDIAGINPTPPSPTPTTTPLGEVNEFYSFTFSNFSLNNVNVIRTGFSRKKTFSVFGSVGTDQFESIQFNMSSSVNILLITKTLQRQDINFIEHDDRYYFSIEFDDDLIPWVPGLTYTLTARVKYAGRETTYDTQITAFRNNYPYEYPTIIVRHPDNIVGNELDLFRLEYDLNPLLAGVQHPPPSRVIFIQSTPGESLISSTTFGVNITTTTGPFTYVIEHDNQPLADFLQGLSAGNRIHLIIRTTTYDGIGGFEYFYDEYFTIPE